MRRYGAVILLLHATRVSRRPCSTWLYQYHTTCRPTEIVACCCCTAGYQDAAVPDTWSVYEYKRALLNSERSQVALHCMFMVQTRRSYTDWQRSHSDTTAEYRRDQDAELADASVSNTNAGMSPPGSSHMLPRAGVSKQQAPNEKA